MAKLQRETRLRERREEKEARKVARKQEVADGTRDWGQAPNQAEWITREA